VAASHDPGSGELDGHQTVPRPACCGRGLCRDRRRGGLRLADGEEVPRPGRGLHAAEGDLTQGHPAAAHRAAGVGGGGLAAQQVAGVDPHRVVAAAAAAQVGAGDPLPHVVTARLAARTRWKLSTAIPACGSSWRTAAAYRAHGRWAALGSQFRTAALVRPSTWPNSPCAPVGSTSRPPTGPTAVTALHRIRGTSVPHDGGRVHWCPLEAHS